MRRGPTSCSGPLLAAKQQENAALTEMAVPAGAGARGCPEAALNTYFFCSVRNGRHVARLSTESANMMTGGRSAGNPADRGLTKGDRRHNPSVAGPSL